MKKIIVQYQESRLMGFNDKLIVVHSNHPDYKVGDEFDKRNIYALSKEGCYIGFEPWAKWNHLENATI